MPLDFFKKLQFLKKKLKLWNREVFKNIFDEKFKIEKKLAHLKNKFNQEGIDENVFIQERELKKVYNKVLHMEETFWRQKLSKLWLREDDRNTKFFYNYVKGKRVVNKIFSLKNKQSIVLIEAYQINKEVIMY